MELKFNNLWYYIPWLTIVLAHEHVKVPLLANVPFQILKVKATFDRVVEMV
jgi:hypothetical protein